MEQLREIRPVRLEINLDNLTNNIQQIREHVGNDTLIMAIVKGNAYGHGAVTCSETFLKSGADRLGVSILSEGITLRKAGIIAPILLLNYTPPSQYTYLLKHNLTQTIFKYEDAKLLSEEAKRLGKVAKIHLKIDTGMNRIGFIPYEDSINDIIKIVNLPNIEVEGMFTHFAMADDLDKSHTKKQFEKFKWVIDRLENLDIHIPIKHAANSATIIDLPEYKLDMVRPGIILYGYYPSGFVNKDMINIKPAMTLKSGISNIKVLEEGEGIGYGQTFITNRRSKIATLPIGYADGYSRILSSKSYVCINDKKAPLVGNICMDQLMVDVTDIEELNSSDEAILFGYGDNNYPKVGELAQKLGTINYELLCMIGERVPRIYIKGDNFIHVNKYTVE
ncbi:MAG: alanine racemase [Tissierellaceae bacterium]|nr:alanine racemase [Tissierellaceae bacterium]